MGGIIGGITGAEILGEPVLLGSGAVLVGSEGSSLPSDELAKSEEGFGEELLVPLVDEESPKQPPKAIVTNI
jgi:hypothetical protein